VLPRKTLSDAVVHPMEQKSPFSHFVLILAANRSRLMFLSFPPRKRPGSFRSPPTSGFSCPPQRTFPSFSHFPFESLINLPAFFRRGAFLLGLSWVPPPFFSPTQKNDRQPPPCVPSALVSVVGTRPRFSLSVPPPPTQLHLHDNPPEENLQSFFVSFLAGGLRFKKCTVLFGFFSVFLLPCFRFFCPPGLACTKLRPFGSFRISGAFESKVFSPRGCAVFPLFPQPNLFLHPYPERALPSWEGPWLRCFPKPLFRPPGPPRVDWTSLDSFCSALPNFFRGSLFTPD